MDDYLQERLGLLVFLTLLWILSVLYAQINPSASLMIFALILAIFLSLLALRKIERTLPKRIGWATVTCLSAGLFFVPYEAAQVIKNNDGYWQHFERDKIWSLVKEGKIVFVDVTADWCLTCKANELLVLHTPKTVERFKINNVVPMRADWTLPQPEITDFMKNFGEYGIPLYVVFGPGKPQGIKLPQILTHPIIEEAIDTVKAK